MLYLEQTEKQHTNNWRPEMLLTKEHQDIMNQFEKDFKHLRLDREDKSLWSKNIIYGNGETNNIFLAYRSGYSFGKTYN